MVIRILKIIGLVFILLLLGVLIYAYNMLVVTERQVAYEQLNPVLDTSSVEVWETQRETLLTTMQQEQYGTVPTTDVDWEVSVEVLDDSVQGGSAQYELWTMQAPDSDFVLHIVGLFPKSDKPLPMVIASNFCPHHVRYPNYNIPLPNYYPQMCETSDGMLTDLMFNVFGEYLTSYPEEDFVSNEVILANVFLSQGVADDPVHYASGLEAVAEITDTNVDGVLAAWAWTFSEVNRVFETDERVDAAKTATYGHSRDGKAALLAAAFDEEIDLVLTHQSGKGGVSAWQREVGESVEAVTESYGFWFTPSFKDFAGRDTDISVDQHALLAAVAPRPVLISTAWMDKWGDPAGAMLSALNATPVYELYGATGVTDGTLKNYDPSLELSYFIRSWTHGVRASDWDAFFTFMSEQFSDEEVTNDL